MKRFLLALGLAAALCSPAVAYSVTFACSFDGPVPGVLPCASLAQYVAPPASQKLPPGITIPPVGAVGDPDQGKIGTPNIIINQAPPAAAVIETGTLAGQALTWVITVAGGALSIILTGLLVRLFQKMGVQISDAARARLQEIILNGLSAGAKEAASQMQGRGKIDIKQATVASTVRYVQAHGADTMKQLGLDPTSPAAVEAIKARIERAIADPAVPTPPVLNDPPENPALATAGPTRPLAGAPRGF